MGKGDTSSGDGVDKFGGISSGRPPGNGSIPSKDRLWHPETAYSGAKTASADGVRDFQLMGHALVIHSGPNPVPTSGVEHMSQLAICRFEATTPGRHQGNAPHLMQHNAMSLLNLLTGKTGFSAFHEESHE